MCTRRLVDGGNGVVSSRGAPSPNRGKTVAHRSTPFRRRRDPRRLLADDFPSNHPQMKPVVYVHRVSDECIIARFDNATLDSNGSVVKVKNSLGARHGELLAVIPAGAPVIVTEVYE